MHEGNGNELNASRGNRIKSWKLAARCIQRKRKGLRAVTEEIAPGKNIILAEALVNLCDHAGQAVGRGSNRRSVRTVWAAYVISRRRLGHRNWMIRCGPWVPRQESGDN